MFELSTTMTVQMSFKDRERREALVTRRFPSGASVATIEADTLLLCGLMNDLSNAIIPSFELKWEWRDEEAATSEDESLPVTASIGLFYRNEADEYEALWIPGPKAELFEMAGDYTGIRADASNTTLIPWILDAATTLSGVVTPEGEPFPNIYVVGGLAL